MDLIIFAILTANILFIFTYDAHCKLFWASADQGL